MKGIIMNNLKVCMDCGYEWESNTHSCPKCGSGNYAEETEEE